jgi:hypothetical protein
MARLRQRHTGSVVNVPDEHAAAFLTFGYYDWADEASASKAPAKKVPTKPDSNK